MPNDKVFKKIEKLISGKIPEGIEKILSDTGFDLESTILLIKEDSIESIETYLKQNVQILVDTPYANFTENNRDFKFKPGHKAFILNLPKVLQEKKKKIITISDIELKEKLVGKVANFCSKNSVQVTVDTSYITQFQQISGKIKCKFSCPFCESKFCCEYSTYWNVSNLEKHIKSHLKKDNTSSISFEHVIVSSHSENSTSNTLANRKIHCFSNEHTEELEEVLNEN